MPRARSSTRRSICEPFRLDHAHSLPVGITVRDGAAVAGRLQRVRRQLVAGTASERRHSAGPEQSGQSGRDDVVGMRTGHGRQVALARLRRAAGQSARRSGSLRHGNDHAADAEPELPRRAARADGHGARDGAGHHLRGDLAEQRPSRSSTRPAARRLTAAGGVQHLGNGGPDCRQTGGHRAALGHLPHRHRVGAIPTQTVTVQHAATSQQWTITIDGNTVARKTAAAALVLDRSGSMLRGPRRRSEQARVAAAGSRNLRRRHARRGRRRRRPLQRGRAAAAASPSARLRRTVGRRTAAPPRI